MQLPENHLDINESACYGTGEVLKADGLLGDKVQKIILIANEYYMRNVPKIASVRQV